MSDRWRRLHPLVRAVLGWAAVLAALFLLFHLYVLAHRESPSAALPVCRLLDADVKMPCRIERPDGERLVRDEMPDGRIVTVAAADWDADIATWGGSGGDECRSWGTGSRAGC